MRQYYYFAASLPMLKPGDRPPLSSVEFRQSCERLLAREDYRKVVQARLNASAASVGSKIGLLQRYQDAEFALRNELVKLRSKKRTVDLEKHLRPEALNPLWAGAAREIAEQETPLKAEHLLNNVLWGVLDNLVAGHYFDLDFLAAYHLKLQILERNARFKLEAGREKLESILTGDMKDG